MKPGTLVWREPAPFHTSTDAAVIKSKGSNAFATSVPEITTLPAHLAVLEAPHVDQHYGGCLRAFPGLEGRRAPGSHPVAVRKDVYETSLWLQDSGLEERTNMLRFTAGSRH
jgi:hypothetical protein